MYKKQMTIEEAIMELENIEKSIDFSVPIGLETIEKCSILAKKLVGLAKNDAQKVGFAKNLMLQSAKVNYDISIYICNGDINVNPEREIALNLVQNLVLLRNAIDLFFENHTITIEPNAPKSFFERMEELKSKRDNNPDAVN